MPPSISPGDAVLKKSLMAALIGSSCGAAAEYWTAPARAAIEVPATVDVPDIRAGVPPADVSAPAPSEQVSGPPTNRPGALDVESGDAVRRAKECSLGPARPYDIAVHGAESAKIRTRSGHLNLPLRVTG